MYPRNLGVRLWIWLVLLAAVGCREGGTMDRRSMAAKTLLYGSNHNATIVWSGPSGTTNYQTPQLIHIEQGVPRLWTFLIQVRIVEAHIASGAGSSLLVGNPHISIGLGSSQMPIDVADPADQLVYAFNGIPTSFTFSNGTLIKQSFAQVNHRVPVPQPNDVQEAEIRFFPASSVQVYLEYQWLSSTVGDSITVQTTAFAAPFEFGVSAL